jgi:hypothetical protein
LKKPLVWLRVSLGARLFGGIVVCFGEYQQKKVQNNNDEDRQPDHPDQFFWQRSCLPFALKYTQPCPVKPQFCS